MAGDRLSGIGRTALAVALAVVIVVAALIGYRRYTRDYAVAIDDSGLAVARVVAGRLYGSSDLRVSRLSGTVQATAASSRWWGWLTASRVVKAPYEVDYFVDLRQLDPGDFRYDAASRTLLVEVPDVTVARPNVDEGNVTIDQTSGLFVGREAMAEMQKRASATATQVVAATARAPQNMAKARANGRVALERLFAGTLSAAGLPVTVEVRFAGEPRRGEDTRWDLTRSLQEVLGQDAMGNGR